MDRADKNAISRERLLDVAEALFAEKGFHAVTVREITRAAHCNLASVNYYFGNKQKLYLEVFRARWIPRARKIQAGFKGALSARDGKSLTGIVHALAEAFLKGPLTDDERLRHAQLMIREMVMPTPAADILVEQVIQPFFGELGILLRPFLTEETEREQVMLNILSVFSMVIYFNFARLPVMRVTGREYDDDFKERLVEHIVQFSLTGLDMKRKEGA